MTVMTVMTPEPTRRLKAGAVVAGAQPGVAVEQRREGAAVSIPDRALYVAEGPGGGFEQVLGVTDSGLL